ncbi:Aspartyl protease [Desulfonispora thiosulfatigenes DSM 11270]|uniref:Aspartyl protease n=1 Tax=Desulfonispora thiosulfatigenes DSM 11270 TaxID=656914 RepID=A0A1W1VFY7_DESTI|nr:retropepsin-like aspartic protease [Desulfonispora thiosulfatigenes]SMB92288.1 Aspartyl protease [Desulfonispora thiosulfatigenes DSM 11270]
MKIEFRDGLLYTSIKLTYKGKTKIIPNMVIDTGAAQTLISQEIAEQIGIEIEGNEQIVLSRGIGGTEVSYVKEVDEVIIGNTRIKNKKLDFTSIGFGDINGLLGLDLLMKAGGILDLKNISFSSVSA